MPSHKYAEISIGDQIEYYSEEDGLWGDYMRMHDFIQWKSIKTVARRFLSPKYYQLFVLQGERGFRQEDLGVAMGCSRQLASYHLTIAVGILREKFAFFLQNRVYMRGGFSAHCSYERLLKENLYNDRFKKEKIYI